MSVRPLNEDLAEVAKVVLNEDPSRLEESLHLLKEWIRKQPHLNARTDDQWLLAFLRGCKFSLERTKKKIDLYYTLRSTAPDIFCLNHTDPKIMEILDTGLALVLPKTASPTAPRVILLRSRVYDPEKYNIMEIMAFGVLMQQIWFMEDDNVIVNGLIIILDLKDTKLSHFIDITPMQLKKIATLNQEAAPLRMKGIHFLNMASIVETFFNFGKTFFTEKNKSRLYVHSKNYNELYKHVPKDILPIEYGGNLSISTQEIIEYWKNKFHQYHAWFEEDMKYGTVESLRSEKSNSAVMFGVEGSFRRLELD